VIDPKTTQDATGGEQVVAVDTESLLKYEQDTSEASLKVSGKAWMQVLNGWGIPADRKIVREELEKNQGSYHPPGPTASGLYNAKEILGERRILSNFVRVSPFYRQELCLIAVRPREASLRSDMPLSGCGIPAMEWKLTILSGV
jgi:hypothetical protein